MTVSKVWKLRAACLAVALSVAGCGAGGLQDVTGKVTFDGKPVAGLEVRFEPVDPTIGTTAIGYTVADGTYRLHYPGDKTGAPAGEYKVSIGGGDTDGETGKRVRVPAKYNTATELKATVKSGSNTFNFDTTSK